jgi:hypothetical protein
MLFCPVIDGILKLKCCGCIVVKPGIGLGLASPFQYVTNLVRIILE